MKFARRSCRYLICFQLIIVGVNADYSGQADVYLLCPVNGIMSILQCVIANHIPAIIISDAFAHKVNLVFHAYRLFSAQLAYLQHIFTQCVISESQWLKWGLCSPPWSPWWGNVESKWPPHSALCAKPNSLSSCQHQDEVPHQKSPFLFIQSTCQWI